MNTDRLEFLNASYNTKDWLLEGLETALASLQQLEASEAKSLSDAMWRILIRSLPDTEWGRNQWSHGEREVYGPRGGYHGREDFEASFIGRLKQAA